MALRQVLLSYKIGEKKTFIEALREKSKDFEQRKAEMNKREADLEAAINEQTPDTDAETKAAVEKAVEEFSAEAEKLEEEIKQNAEEIASVEAEVAEMQKELDALSETPAAPAEPPAEPENRETNKRSNERSFAKMKVRAFDKMNLQERAALVARSEVKEFLTRAKALITRSVTGGQLTIPTVLLPMVREEIERQSKMLKYVNHIYVPGDARIPVMGEIFEAVWTEQCENLNEQNLEIWLVELNAYKVGAFNAVCRYIVEDSAENILDILMYALAVGIAKAVDKAILFGKGEKMPLGIAEKLYEVEGNFVTISAEDSTEKKLMQKIMEAFGKADGSYSKAKTFFAMNDKTRMFLMSELLTYTDAGALVSGLGQTMPVIGGDIVSVDFIPDNLIVAGYGSNYIMAERGAMTFDTNDRLRWIEEQVLVKATARYDGKPVIPTAFVAIGINGVDPSVSSNSVTFMPDQANSGGK